MLKDKKLDFNYLPYGDVCKRSHCMIEKENEEDLKALEAQIIQASSK